MIITILKDYKESEKRCSILWLRGKKGFEFLDRRKFDEYDFSGFTLLHPDGKPIEKIGKNEKILLVDSNWRKAKRMYNRLALKYDLNSQTSSRNGKRSSVFHNLKKIRIDGFRSAYPWKKGRPDNGLCSIEVLWVLSLLAGKRDDSLLENYRWKMEFLELNKKF
ncbi:MAG: hypothetical protein HYT16_04375 [DPANN group archaeon]|nr:hypothetical protein [DPANN group archaeon]